MECPVRQPCLNNVDPGPKNRVISKKAPRRALTTFDLKKKIVEVKLNIVNTVTGTTFFMCCRHLDQVHEMIVAVLQEINAKFPQEKSDVQG